MLSDVFAISNFRETSLMPAGSSSRMRISPDAAIVFSCWFIVEGSAKSNGRIIVVAK
jgi:hypothetical protein